MRPTGLVPAAALLHWVRDAALWPLFGGRRGGGRPFSTAAPAPSAARMEIMLARPGPRRPSHCLAPSTVSMSVWLTMMLFVYFFKFCEF